MQAARKGLLNNTSVLPGLFIYNLMAYRFTATEKWNDPWFRSLNPHQKLLWTYYCDNCNLAGFLELDDEKLSFDTKMSAQELLPAKLGLCKGVLESGTWVWVKNFLRHQRNLPLNPDNNAHKHIIEKIIEQRLRFDLRIIQEILGANEGLFSPTGKGKVEVMVKVKEGGTGETELSNRLQGFGETCLSRQIWSENFCMTTGSNLDDLPKIITDFNSHVISMGKGKSMTDLEEYQSYMTKWKLNKKSISVKGQKAETPKHAGAAWVPPA